MPTEKKSEKMKKFQRRTGNNCPEAIGMTLVKRIMELNIKVQR
jgi:hypothetical protein